MADSRMVIIDVGDDGEIKVETKGWHGKACTSDKAVAMLKEVLGHEVARSLTPAYMEKEEGKVTAWLPLCG